MTVYVTSLGIISGLGIGVEENFASIRSEKSGLRLSKEFDLMLGDVALSDEELAQLLDVESSDTSRTILLSLLAAKEAWKENAPHKGLRDGFIFGTSVGAMDIVENYYFELLGNPSSDISDKMIHENGRCANVISDLLGIGGFINTISTACSSSANAIMQGGRMIKSGYLDRVLVGGCDPMALFDLKGFESLNIYDPDQCKPFDQNRKGLNLGEAAAFLLLENEKSVNLTGNKVICELRSWSNATDVYHQTASSPEGEGATRTMTEALTMAGLQAKDISYINAHGTGTPNNDLSESKAILNVFKDQVPPLSSTKSYTGHTLAAAGAVEAVCSIQAILDQALIPNLNFNQAIEYTGLIPIRNYEKDIEVKHVLSNSFGFGGNCTSLIFSKLD